MNHDRRLKAKALKKEITALYYVYQDPEVPKLPKIVIIFTLAYALSPIDLIPDFIPVLGYLDDLIILPALITLSLKLIPKERMQVARKRAEDEPLKLKKNWVIAVIFVLLWLALLCSLIIALIGVIRK